MKDGNVEYAGVEYKDEHSRDLRLHLFRGALELEAFPVLRRAHGRMGEFEVDASIIGASHAVQIRRGSETITEVLACHVEAVDLYADQLVDVWSNASVKARPTPGVDYQFRLDVRPLEGTRSQIARFRESLASANELGSIGLAFQFPQKTMETPETLLRVSAGEKDLRIESVHVYPGEQAAVFSETLLAPFAAGRLDAAEELVEVGSR